jgi:hypothetical protein
MSNSRGAQGREEKVRVKRQSAKLKKLLRGCLSFFGRGGQSVAGES